MRIFYQLPNRTVSRYFALVVVAINVVDVIGHLGMALIWLAPSWLVFDHPKTAVTVIVASFWFGMLPDIDLVLSNYIQTVNHHGLFHTVVVVTLLAAVLGPALGWMLKELCGDSEWFSPEATNNAGTIGFLGVWIAGLSHLFADMLSAPDIAPPIEPFWPLFNASVVQIDVFRVSSFWATWGLLTVGVVVNAGLWYWKRGNVRRE